MTRTPRAVVWLMYLIDILGQHKSIFGGSVGGTLHIDYSGSYIVLAKPARHPSTTPSIAGKCAITFSIPKQCFTHLSGAVLQYPIHTISSLC
ncbi:hypothetical protein GYMLUDRAFT_249600 [Collybiopsis luxurians FD-317 M1]|uniref:Secreted protein n=1 Tax=Collybiopsis luxurians FD-317 M1 TaxID=944289 RepID=A0A0D0BWZ5_9AGAR|nr:hypothetical protein GYMLUDRAFT_249600 [Collybiopsis luxurians FD-317 M1]